MSDENEELRKAGLKVTLPRLKILQILEAAGDGGEHLSAEDVYLKLRTDGEALHKAAKDQESVDTLAKAMKMLGE